MKTMTKVLLVIGVATLAATTLYAKSSSRQGTEVVHFTAHVTFTNTGVETGSGTAQINEAMQGAADHESLSVSLKGLIASNSYSLTVTTDAGGPTELDAFTSDSKGNAKLAFNNSGKGKKTIAFPSGVLPLTGVTELDVVDTTTSQTVLTAGADQTSKVKYMVKKPLDDTAGNGETGTIDLSASSKKGKFSLAAAGLTDGGTYVLVVNGNPVSTNTATAKGALRINASPSPADVLNANAVALNDDTGTTILSTTVP